MIDIVREEYHGRYVIARSQSEVPAGPELPMHTTPLRCPRTPNAIAGVRVRARVQLSTYRELSSIRPAIPCSRTYRRAGPHPEAIGHCKVAFRSTYIFAIHNSARAPYPEFDRRATPAQTPQRPPASPWDNPPLQAPSGISSKLAAYCSASWVQYTTVVHSRVTGARNHIPSTLHRATRDSLATPPQIQSYRTRAYHTKLAPGSMASESSRVGIRRDADGVRVDESPHRKWRPDFTRHVISMATSRMPPSTGPIASCNCGPGQLQRLYLKLWGG